MWGVYVFILTAGILFIDIWYGLSTQFWWTDNVDHLLGGVLAGLIGLWWALALIHRASLVHAILGALILGALVEVVEYALGWGISSHMSRTLDTTKDMVVDAIGGWVAWRMARKSI